MTQRRAYLYAVLSVILWSTVATAFKIALNELTLVQLLFYSSLISTIALFVIILVQQKAGLLRKISSKELFKYSITGLLNPFLYYIVLFEAYRLLPAQEALALNYTWAIMIVLFSILFLGQKINKVAIISILFSFVGVVVIATRGDILSLEFENPYGSILAFGSSFIWASYWILNLKDEKTDEVIKLFIGFTFGCIYIFIYNLFAQTNLFEISIKGLLSSVYIGLFEMSITFYFWLRAIKLSINTAKVSSLIFLSPFISLNLIGIILGEPIQISTVIGLSMIVVGIIATRLKSS
jgi:drug/metabolite transporter (DMT)-like permease